MKKQLILIGVLAVALAVAGTVFGLNRGAGEMVQGALSAQTSNTTINQPAISSGTENLSDFISLEGLPPDFYYLLCNTPGLSVPRINLENLSEFISLEGLPPDFYYLLFATPGVSVPHIAVESLTENPAP